MSETKIRTSQGTRNAVATLLAVAAALAVLLGGIALIVSQGQAQTCSRAGGTWVAHDEPTLGTGAVHERKCQL